MTALFQRIQPAQRFHLNRNYIAHSLKIPPSTIVRIECWAYVLFIHRYDRGGQFVSYRQLNRWTRTIAQMIQTSPNLEDLKELGQWINQESIKFEEQYSAIALDYLRQLWVQRREQLTSLSETETP